MELFLQVTVFILGACIISFLKVIAQDYPNINYTRRSRCDYCHRILQWYEIIPIIGYFIVHGKCSGCKNQIDFYNPLQEFAGGTFLLLNVQFGTLNYLPLFLMLIILGFSDAFYGYIYPIFYLLALPTVIWHFSTVHLLAAVIIYLTLLLLNNHSLIGLGDIEIMALLALIFDLNDVLRITILACFLCIIQFLFNKKRSYRFIPYLTVSTGIIYLIFVIRT
ncbi:prepilin peptidase [Companilactobacillus kimchii]|uniref:Prepilin peptidase A24 N-terminal domain-containing protein n=2 Tax=Companilactobacillus kimchii TaxID=2801452 RepID=A0ABR5NTV8_9LACO|nr:prepilin peptidase [Companilactobacillus kimchii]KAE9558701.1 hypothetical protein ATN91_13950 [Companilactobacillus kimchii]KRK51830.1 hypothetical protein FC97_GL000624 [Companilactobacillus kimchii DSM 13961 = JCM 10707]OWF33878.1 hypothetical protein LKACC12383_00488 [Companilactobacillus kimchii]